MNLREETQKLLRKKGIAAWVNQNMMIKQLLESIVLTRGDLPLEMDASAPTLSLNWL